MATTDARSGFRLPWSSDRPSDATDEPSGDSSVDVALTADENATAEHPTETHPAVDPWTHAPAHEPVEATGADGGPSAETVEAPAAKEPARASAKRPNKFLADLTKAMQAAAEEARTRSTSQLQAEAKTHVESIHARSATEAANLRRAADDDVAAVRDWSKAEIARIREETEQRITDRKARLETEIEHHAGVIEREIDAVQGLVAGFEADMDAFFERLLAEEDPTRFATMAENLPEPPSFDDLTSVAEAQAEVEAATEVAGDTEVEGEAWAEPIEGTAETVDETDETNHAAAVVEEAVDPDAILETGTAETDESSADAGEAELIGEAEDVSTTDASETAESPETGEPSMDGYALGFGGMGEGMDGDGEVDREAAFAAIQAAAEAAASAEVAADAAARAEAVADVAIEIIGHESETEADPRFAALGLNPDDPADFEAVADQTESDEIPTINDDALAARLAGLVPSSGKGGSNGATSTQVVVVGLVSVASIASFKRHLGRVSGVQSVGVSSGPDGEFVFAVTHTADTSLRDAIASLPSFQARVTSSTDGVMHVTAHDPEADG